MVQRRHSWYTWNALLFLAVTLVLALCTYALDSAIVLVLRQGQMVTVLEEKPMMDFDGKEKLRARVALVEEETAAKAIAESWWKPFDPEMEVGLEEIVQELQMMSPKSGRSWSPKSTNLLPRIIQKTINNQSTNH